MGYYGFPKYVSVAEKREKALKKIKKLKKKRPDLKPVVIEDKALAKSWWGKSWNKNLERYADYSNRIGRGRSYVRHMAVLDLKIESGKIKSLVQGSYRDPYEIEISIKGISKTVWKRMKGICEGKIESLSELIEGSFPKALRKIFMEEGKGLFPKPAEIEFDCDCPDWASMCKHVAATLYGVGARLDDDPLLFFKLRKVNIEDLISKAVKNKTQKLLKKADSKKPPVIDDSDLSSVFGIDMDDEFMSSVNSKKSKKKKKVKKLQKIKPPAKKSTLQIKSNVHPVVLMIRRRTVNGISVRQLHEKSGIEISKIRNIIAVAKKKGLIRNEKRGFFIKG